MNPPPVDLIRVPAFLGNGHSEIEFIIIPLQMKLRRGRDYIGIITSICPLFIYLLVQYYCNEEPLEVSTSHKVGK